MQQPREQPCISHYKVLPYSSNLTGGPSLSQGTPGESNPLSALLDTHIGSNTLRGILLLSHQQTLSPGGGGDGWNTWTLLPYEPQPEYRLRPQLFLGTPTWSGRCIAPSSAPSPLLSVSLACQVCSFS